VYNVAVEWLRFRVNFLLYTIALSLDKFRAKFKGRLGQPYILYTKDVMEKDGIIHLPLYMAMFL